jgi:hypothetical protein
MISFARQDARFLAMLPDIRKRAEKAFRRVNANDREELVAEVIGQAFCAYRRLVERGKESVAYATPLANYAVKHLRCGRRLCGQESAGDVSSYFCQRTPLESIPDELADDRTPPDDVVALRMDFSAWLVTLRPAERGFTSRQKLTKLTRNGQACSLELLRTGRRAAPAALVPHPGSLVLASPSFLYPNSARPALVPTT